MISKLIPFWMLATIIIMVMLVSIEAGYRIGVAFARRKAIEKESTVSVVSGAILSLLSFMVAFTFGILYGRFDARKELVRREANAIETAWLRSDFLPEPDRSQAAGMLNEYINSRLKVASILDDSTILKQLRHSDQLQNKIWATAVHYARDKNLSGSFLYVQSVNEMIDIQNLRVARGFQAKTPTGLWVSLYSLLFFSMGAIGYQSAVAGSRRTLATFFLTVSFTLVFLLLTALEQPRYGFFRVSQQPLINVQIRMGEGKHLPAESFDLR
jgi:uncharacterized protein YneF (UPF0154 family)